MREDMAIQLLRRLDEYGLEVESAYTDSPVADLEPGIPERAVVRHRSGASDFVLIFTLTMTMSELARQGADLIAPGHLLVLGSRISEKSADHFRRRGINFLDEAGNAYVDFDGVRIDVRGRRSEGSTGSSPRSVVQRTNLFSTKRSQLIFALLAWSEMSQAPIRELAYVAGVSVGQAQETLALLQEAGFIWGEGAAREINRGGELLDQWAAAYPTGLGGAKRTRGFAGATRLSDELPEGPIVVSGEAAMSNEIRPQTLTIYTAHLAPRTVIANRWRTDQEPNIFVRPLFWRDPRRQELPMVSVAPSVLVYADLLASGDGRQIETAGGLRQTDARLASL